MTEDYETDDDRDFDAENFGTLSIGRRILSGGIDFATRDSGNASAAVIPIDGIWDVIDHLIELAGPRAFATGKTVQTVTARDWFRITGRGIVVSVDVPKTDGIGRGDRVRFTLVSNDRAQEGIIAEGKTYLVAGVEESRCLVDHGPGSQTCVMSRGLAVREVEDSK